MTVWGVFDADNRLVGPVYATKDLAEHAAERAREGGDWVEVAELKVQQS